MHFAAASPKPWMGPCAAVITQGRKSPLDSDFDISYYYLPALIAELKFQSWRHPDSASVFGLV